ncbi:MAG TPA: hypothetical protein VG291_17185 [Xanthobacteraceae bacterium]|jgi:hypothetical protein|nr:hypothetical protein [Xanthobacteraceae bacterium]
MKPGVIAHLRRYRRPAVIVGAGLIAVQAFLAGLVLAQAELRLAPDLAGDAGFAVICHGNGGSNSDPGTAPEPAKSQHPCCLTCAAGAAAPAVAPEQLIVLRADRPWLLTPRFFSAAAIQIAPRAVRAGPSQAPPRQD